MARAYYWHRFYSHQPDLNFDNPRVRKMVLRVVDFWLGMGVDGLRLDAVPYLFEREGTNCENLPETYAYLGELRAHVDQKFRNRMLLAEANQWPEDAVAYFGKGDICHMAFHFPLMPRIFMALHMEDRFPIVDILEQTPSVPEICQWALFLRNHDELTLEMVTDEERDYMYRVFARDSRARINLGIRRRLAPLMDNHRRRIELMNMLLLSLPGTPVLYYGDEIGMGDNYYLGDRNGVRTPMQWSPDRNAGFSQANPQRLFLPVIIDPEYHYESLNVETQQRNPTSLLWWMKRVISFRKRIKAFGRGTLEFCGSENPKVLAFIRKFQEEHVLVIANLSRFYQVAQLGLSAYAGYIPEEIFGQNRFPAIRETPYILTLGPHSSLWLQLRKEEEPLRIRQKGALPELQTTKSWEMVLEGNARQRLEEEILPAYLPGCRWFGRKAKAIRKVSIVESIPIGEKPDLSFILFLEVRYTESPPEFYQLPLSFAWTRKVQPPEEEFIVEGQRVLLDYAWLTIRGQMILEEVPQGVIARLVVDRDEGILYDAVFDDKFREAMLAMIGRHKKVRGQRGILAGSPGKEFRSLGDRKPWPLNSRVLKAEQTNTSLLYEDVFYGKLFRGLKEGINPDLEISRFLTEKACFTHIPPYAGSLEYRPSGGEIITVGLLQGSVSNQGDAWTFTQDALGRYFEHVLSRQGALPKIPEASPALLSKDFSASIPMGELIEGHFLEMVSLLGRRTGEMHLALSSRPEEVDFTPEPFSLFYQRSLFQSMRTLLRRVMQTLKSRLRNLPADLQAEASWILGAEASILSRLQKITARKLDTARIRIHGDYHLGQVLYTGKDFILIDFEGEPARAMTERRLKHSPFRDVAGMMRSFHYASCNALLREASLRPDDIPAMMPWTDLWYKFIWGVYLNSYFETVKGAPFIPGKKEETETMLKIFLLEKAVYELGYELNHRLDWLMVPIKGIKDLLGQE